MTTEKRQQVQHFLTEGCRKANEFDDQNNQVLKEYWKGQVMGMIKIIHLFDEGGIETSFYLKQLP